MCAPKISARAQVFWQISFKIVEPNASWWHLPQELVQLLYLFPETCPKESFNFHFFDDIHFFRRHFFNPLKLLPAKNVNTLPKGLFPIFMEDFSQKMVSKYPPSQPSFHPGQFKKKWYQIIGQSQIKLFPSFWCFACFGNNTLLIRIWYLIYIYTYIKIWG